jgi:phenylalanyl-tRNA synthetase beta chain
MKFSIKWLEKLVAIKSSPFELSVQLTDAGLEVEGIEGDIIEIAVPPNRADCLGVIGIAREAAAINNIQFKTPAIAEVPATMQDKISLQVQDSQACPKYLSRIIKNINPSAKTPQWMQDYLAVAGVNSISPVVDITNYVMLELGQPLHAFDLAKIDGGIIVRRANKGEKLTLLDDKILELTPDTLVIADDSKPVAVGGIMGGKDSGVNSGTKDILFESAYFDPVYIRLAARRLGIQSDSSYRYERCIDASMREAALERATQLVLEIVGGEAGPVVTFADQTYLPRTVELELRYNRITKIAGIQIPAVQVQEILRNLGMVIQPKDSAVLHVIVPSFRTDITREIDLIEDVVRIFGFEKITAQLPVGTLGFSPQPESTVIQERILECLINRGYNEAITYSFIDADLAKNFVPSLDNTWSITNPISADMSLMRPSLLPGLINALSYNQNRQQNRIRLFEVGLRFVADNSGLQQIKTIAGVCTGAYLSEGWANQKSDVDFFDLKGDIAALFCLAHNSAALEFKASTDVAMHPGQCVEIMLHGKTIGKLGVLHPALQQSLGLTTAVCMFEVDYLALEQGQLSNFKMFSKFPAIRRDLALLLDKQISSAKLEDAIRNTVGDLLTDLVIFDLYAGKGVPEGKKSMAVGLTLQNVERTLTDTEVTDLFDNLIKHLEKNFQAVLR